MAELRPVLLTVSGSIPPDLESDVAAGRRPRPDYAVMASAFDADLVDVDAALAARPRLGPVLRRLLGTGGLLGWHCFRQRRSRDVIVTDGEQVGLVLALLSRMFGCGRARHAMIVHILSVPKKERLVRFARLAPLIDRYIVYCSAQQRFVQEDLGVPLESIVLTPFMVDTAFFDPAVEAATPRRRICSAGLERRDYGTFIDAVADIDVEVVIAAASPWSRRGSTIGGRRLPANVTVQRLSQYDLRALYASSRFVVMPLEQVDFQAGITAILEAMSMERAVIVTRTSGQTDTVVDGVTGCYVEPGDVEGMRQAIEQLLEDGERAATLGREGRRWALDHADIETYADRLGEVVASLRRSHTT